MNPNSKNCPPAGIYEVGVLSYHCTAIELSVWFRLAADGPFKGYYFFDAFDRDYKNKREKDLLNGAMYLVDANNPDSTDVARLVRRIVNGEQTLSVKAWGWR
jgi:hypothetical protein